MRCWDRNSRKSAWSSSGTVFPLDAPLDVQLTMRLQQLALMPLHCGNAVASLEIIEAYPDDKYLPSFLLRGEIRGAAFHAQIATDLEGNNVRVVTMYTPDADEWDEGFRKRRKR